MRSDLLSKRLFTAGCFGLPWLWVVHVLYNRGLESGDQSADGNDPPNQGLLDADEHFPEEPTTMSPAQIVEARRGWVSKCQLGAMSVFGVWAVWIVLAQVLKGEIPGSWYVRSPDDGEWTGW